MRQSKLMIKKRILAVFRFCMKAGIIVAVLVLLINIYMKASVKSRIIPIEDAYGIDADCILVLGAGIQSDNSPSNMLEDRLLQGITLYNNGASLKLLMSGDHGQVGYDEVNVMKQFAVDRGIPSSDIFMDHAGFSTYESMYRARDIFQAKKVIIVTQEYHLYRALYTARELGLDAYGVSADLRVYSGRRGNIYRGTREILARAKDFAVSIIQPKPTYLGEGIPVSGNGDATND